ncbi:MAG: PucR family transcriptional regulator ligand-binding domain-containing protein, partial [Actinomycetota bacterium]
MNSPDSLSDSHQADPLTLREVLGAPSFEGTDVLAGSSGLDRIVSSVNVMENPDIVPWVKRGELLITVGYSLQGSDTDLAALVESLDDQGLAGFGVKLGPYIAEVGADALDIADRRGFPILALPAAVSFDDLIADVYGARDSLLLGGLYRRSDREQELMKVALEGGGPAQVAAKLAQLATCEVLVLGQGNELIAHYVGAEEAPLEDAPLDSARFDDALNAPIVFGSTYVGQLYVFPNDGPGTRLSPGLVPTSAKIMA